MELTIAEQLFMQGFVSGFEKGFKMSLEKALERELSKGEKLGVHQGMQLGLTEAEANLNIDTLDLVTILLNNAPEWNDAEIAEMAKVKPAFVRKIRTELSNINNPTA